MSDTPFECPAHEIIVVPAVGRHGRSELQRACIVVRTEVFVHEQGFPLDVEVDNHDPTATHILLRLTPSLTPIGTIRAVRMGEGQYYKLSRLAVLKEYRCYRFGRDLVLALHEWAKDDARKLGDSGSSKIAKVVCHSQIPVKSFYAKYGYEAEGDEFDEDGAPHQKMVAWLST